MRSVLQWMLVSAGVLMAGGTALGFSRSPHWFVRGWDFPRAQIASIAGLAGLLYYAFFFQGRAWEWVFLSAVALTVAWQCIKIRPFTPLASVQVERADHARVQRREDATLRLLICNVLMENRDHARFLRTVRKHDPDVVLALETDAAWVRALEPLARTHPHTVLQPQDNHYGLALFSRLPLVEPHVRFIVQDDIPSVHTGITLRSGDRIVLHGLHPRPPEPIGDQDSTPRDAELVLVGREIGEGEEVPTVVAGDLNDVAWSPTSELFLRLSGLLDPRVGRGLFNSYNANNPLFRFPLDHVFHSGHFQLVELRRLEAVGSDHFPLLIRLLYAPEARQEQPETPRKPGDLEDAEERVQEEMEAARTGDDRPSRE
ncbi:MAG TPA: endonuclease/exonuclease/phosphatase family protein [Longimicrobiaceae bacterium]|nr:endonuclease/exonuclease/phosphatase family protein [Longimicrobiaceae bacterium]